MAAVHDFKAFPELTNRQMEIFYFASPHKQITEDFTGIVRKVTDGDTIRVETTFRDFLTTIRFSDLAAPELDEIGGVASQEWLSDRILGKSVDIILTKSRVDKWGRILGTIMFGGQDMADESINTFHGVAFADRKEGRGIPSIESLLPNLDEEFK